MTMRKISYTSILAALVVAPATIAWTSPTDTLVLQPQSKLWIAGTSTVKAFQCAATSLTVDVQAVPGAAALVASGEKGITSVAVRVPAAQVDCRNGTMNSHMLKALKATENPEIAFDLASYDLAPVAEGVTVTLIGDLTLGGAKKTITMTANATPVEGGVLKITGVHDVRLSDYGLKPPKLMLGTMKVHDLVKVHFELLLKE
jgi:polyisoprenoid-binding protein YceI